MTSKGLVLLAVSATAFSTLAIFMKYAFEAGVNVGTLLAFRFLFSAVFCFLCIENYCSESFFTAGSEVAHCRTGRSPCSGIGVLWPVGAAFAGLPGRSCFLYVSCVCNGDGGADRLGKNEPAENWRQLLFVLSGFCRSWGCHSAKYPVRGCCLDWLQH